MDGYMTLREASEKWNIGERRIRTLCAEGRIEGAKKLGPMWIVPVIAEKPNDHRVRTGKYIKEKTE